MEEQPPTKNGGSNDCRKFWMSLWPSLTGKSLKPFFVPDVPRGLLMQLWGAALNGRTSMRDRICRYRCRMFPCAIHTVRCHSQSTAYWQFLNKESRPHLPNSLFL